MLMPEVYIFDTTDNNEIITPSICMSFIPGETVSHVWLDETSRESLRLSILTSITKSVAQFLSLTFGRIGSDGSRRRHQLSWLGIRLGRAGRRKWESQRNSSIFFYYRVSGVLHGLWDSQGFVESSCQKDDRSAYTKTLIHILALSLVHQNLTQNIPVDPK
ncbi:hypothetical protein FPOAC2_05121 [Fusarium poae]|jgi:hypothetical protein